MEQSTTEPQYLGMVLCDNVLRDPDTGKYYLLGTSTHTFARSFPARYRRMCVYVALTGIHGSCPITIQAVRADSEAGEDVQIGEAKGTIQAPDPLAVAEITLKINNLVFPRAGQYHFQLLAGSSLLGERRFTVHQMEQSQ